MIDCTKCKHYSRKQDAQGMYGECAFGVKLYQGDILTGGCSTYEEKNTIEGKKYDTGKNRVGLMCQGFSKALWEVAEVSTFGANKYGANNWQYLDNPQERYLDALCRHLFQYMEGFYYDNESKLPHLAHMCWNALALLEFENKMVHGTLNETLNKCMEHIQEEMSGVAELKREYEKSKKKSEEENGNIH